MALVYAGARGIRQKRALASAIQRLKGRIDLVITEPDMGTGVIVLGKPIYI